MRVVTVVGTEKGAFLCISLHVERRSAGLDHRGATLQGLAGLGERVHAERALPAGHR